MLLGFRRFCVQVSNTFTYAIVEGTVLPYVVQRVGHAVAECLP